MRHLATGRAAWLLAAPLVAAAAHALSADRFPDGRSFWGQAADASAATIVVDADSQRHVGVPYGATVRFDSAGKSFTWRFDGLAGRAVDLGAFAPGFSPRPLEIHIGRDTQSRR